jgi:hypothetical protein
MKLALFIVANITSMLCVVAAAKLALDGVEGWGWFLLVALMACQSLESSEQ